MCRRRLIGAASAVPIFLISTVSSVEDMPGTLGVRSSCLPFMLIMAWTGIIRNMQCMASTVDVERYLELGKKSLAAGQLAEALSHYHMAVEGDPNNYLTYFRRATVYLAMGKSKSALPDLDKVVELKPDFNAARLQRANVKLKQGRLNEAKADYEEALQRDPGNNEAQLNLNAIPAVEDNIQQAKLFYSQNAFEEAITVLAKPIEVCPWDPELHELRAECYLQLKEYMKAITDIRPTTKLRPDNTQAYYKLSTWLYAIGDAEESLKEIRECLKLDADHKSCHTHYKKVKKLVQQIQSAEDAVKEQHWNDCISRVDKMLKIENEVETFLDKASSLLCHCHSQAKNINDGFEHCNQVLNKHPDDIDALCDRGEIFILNEQFEEAVNDFKKAESIDGNLRKVQEGSQRAQKLLKQSQKRDYYKILGVKRTAQKQEIVKAYRKLAAQWHPDQYDGDDKNHAEKMFIDIAAAKEVLTDSEKRAKFDNGEDPLDPEQQAGGGGPFWHQGFNPFGQGGFQFKFHFN